MSTEAHKTSNLAELVCSNSMKSLLPHTAAGELKHEMQTLNSLIIESAFKNRVPAGMALAIEREGFSKYIEAKLNEYPNFKRVDEEVTSVPSFEELEEKNEAWIFATGPLTSDALAKSIDTATGNKERLYFYDAIAPTIDADTINFDKCYFKDRYGEDGKGDYLNIPLEKEAYETFIDEIEKAEMVPLHSFERFHILNLVYL